MDKLSIKASADGLELGIIAIGAQSPKAIVQISHGMCEHKERYVPFMEFLAANGYCCICHDHRGHGESVKSAEDLGFMYEGGWKAMVEDCLLVTRKAKELWPGLPVVLFGHSMGSMVVRSYVKRYDSEICALYVCGCPSYNPASPVGKLLAKLLGMCSGGHNRPKILQQMSFGSFNKPFEAEGPNAWVVSDTQERAKYNADPLCQYQFTSNGFYNLLGLCMDCYGKKGWALGNKKLPVRFISGAEDPCRISDEAIEKAVAAMMAAGYEDVELTTYDGMRHEILNETDKAVVWNDVLAQLDAWNTK